jgi:hypothetical protein
MYVTVHNMVIPEQSAQPVLARSCPSLGPFSATAVRRRFWAFFSADPPLVYIPRCLPQVLLIFLSTSLAYFSISFLWILCQILVIHASTRT